MRQALLLALAALAGCQEGTQKMIDDDNFLGSEDEIQEVAGDELDLMETVARMNPTSDQLQHFANLRGIKHALLDRQAPFTRINPPSVLKGTLGNQKTLRITEGNRQPAPWALIGSNAAIESVVCPQEQVVNWVGDDAETLPITLTVSPVQKIVDLPITAPARPYAVVQYGTRGSLATFEIDIAVGAQWTLNASSVNVQIGLETDGAIVLPPGSPYYTEETLTGMASFRPTTHNLSLTRTRYVSTGNAALDPGTIDVPVPPFSRDLSFLRTDATNTAYLLTFLSNSGLAVYAIAVAAGGVAPNPIPLSGDVMYVRVARTDLSFTSGFERLVFGLAF